MSTDDDVYAMDKPRRGTFIIINNKNFCGEYIKDVREGTDVDAEVLSEVFTNLGFDVTTHTDMKAHEMLNLMEDVAEAEETKTESDCFGVAVLSHGADQGLLYGVNDVLRIDNFTQPIKECKRLVNVPKIFIFQACRGKGLDYGWQSDSTKTGDHPTPRIPMEADFLYAYSTPPGYKAWRHKSNGSWFIQTLCEHLSRLAYSMDLVKILTRVNRRVAIDYETSGNFKQVPSIVSMLTKDLQFTRKTR